MYYTYILNSCDNLHWYIGSTSNIERRLTEHNKGKSTYTKRYKPWKLIYFEKYDSRSEAVKRELFLKSPKGYVEYQIIKNKVK